MKVINETVRKFGPSCRLSSSYKIDFRESNKGGCSSSSNKDEENQPETSNGFGKPSIADSKEPPNVLRVKRKSQDSVSSSEKKQLRENCEVNQKSVGKTP